MAPLFELNNATLTAAKTPQRWIFGIHIIRYVHLYEFFGVFAMLIGDDVIHSVFVLFMPTIYKVSFLMKN